MNGSPTARLLTQLWFVTIAVLAVAVLFLAKVLLLPLGIAILFAFLLAPVVAQLERLRLPRPAAALIVIFGFSALLLVATWTLFTQLVAVADDLPTYRDNITAKLEALHRPSDSAIGRLQQELEKVSDELGIVNATATAALQSPSKTAQKPIGTTPEHPLQVAKSAALPAVSTNSAASSSRSPQPSSLSSSLSSCSSSARISATASSVSPAIAISLS